MFAYLRGEILQSGVVLADELYRALRGSPSPDPMVKVLYSRYQAGSHSPARLF